MKLCIYVYVNFFFFFINSHSLKKIIIILYINIMYTLSVCVLKSKVFFLILIAVTFRNHASSWKILIVFRLWLLSVAFIEIIRQGRGIKSKRYNTKWTKIENTYLQQQKNPLKKKSK
jgi:hypothetical protein